MRPLAVTKCCSPIWRGDCVENGANSSFVHRLADRTIALSDLVANPREEALKISPLGAPHPKIPLPAEIFGAERTNSRGIDLTNEQALRRIVDGAH